jgi:hypothetical protein
MSSLPLQVHEVLEQEYVSMYGPLGEERPSADYTPDQITDRNWACTILAICGFPPASDEGSAIAATLNGIVSATGAETIAKLERSPSMTSEGKLLIAQYEAHQELTNRDADATRELNRRILDEAFTGAVQPLRDLRLGHVYTLLHTRAKTHDRARSALCISGGGIRSATFALGVIQGLATTKILSKFDYLSTVSGGGYIGGWLSSWARRHPQGIAGVQADLIRSDTAAPSRDEVPKTKLEPEPQPVRHLREYSNYLSPKLGLTSGDTWTMLSLYVRNLLLNLLVIVPVLAAALAMPRAYAFLLQNSRHAAPVMLLGSTLLLLLIGFGYLAATRPVAHQGAKKNTDGRFFSFCVIPLAFAGTGISVFWANVNGTENLALFRSGIPLAGAIGALLSMTVWPFSIYYIRLIKRDRANLTWRRFGYEALGTVVGVGITLALFFLIATEVFPDPIQAVPDTATLHPLLRALASSVPWGEVYVCLSVPIVMVIFFIQASIFVGLSGKVNDDYDREWWGRAGAWLLIAAFGIAAFSLIAVFGPVALYQAPVILGSVGGGTGLIAALLGFGSSTPANKKQKEDAGVVGKASNISLALAAPLFVVFFLALIALGTTWLLQKMGGQKMDPEHEFASQFVATVTMQDTVPVLGVPSENRTMSAPLISLAAIRATNHLNVIHNTEAWHLVLVAGALGIASLLSRCIGVNKFSMHALYRNRLIRAYLGASRYVRDPDTFTGFDERDDFKIHQLRPELLWGSSIKQVIKFYAIIQTIPAIAGSLPAQLKDAIARKDHSGAVIHKLVEHLNELLADPKTRLEHPDAAWAESYPPSIRNRAALDAFAGETLSAMARPKDAPPDEGARAPLHVVNVCLNLVTGENLAWQQRKAESFTISPLHSGSVFLGYRKTEDYGGEDGGVSLGTAVTISGAAASPNMGYHSSPAMAFLLALFNVRLGWWLGNPGPVGQKVYGLEHPTTNLAPLFAEVTGNTNDKYPWVYLSDGGHFENLGLYEMVLRRCHYIVLSDAGADPEFVFEDLGNAIRKIRTDLGVPIDIEHLDMRARCSGAEFGKGSYVATATIRYSAIDKDGVDGKLIYVKPGLYEHDFFPRDVYNYARESNAFPHESTADQFFSESQFESYRALGRHAINEICGVYPSKKQSSWRLEPRTFSSVGAFAERTFDLHRPPQAPPSLDHVIQDGVGKVAAAMTHVASIWADKSRPVT